MLEQSMERMRRKSELESEPEEKKPVDFRMINYIVQLQIYSYINNTDVKNLGKIKTKFSKDNMKKLKEKKQPMFGEVQNIGKIKTEFSKGDMKKLKKKKPSIFGNVQNLGKIKIELSKGDAKKEPKSKKPNHNSKVLGLVKNNMMMCAQNKFEAKRQELSSAPRVDRLAENKLKSKLEEKKPPDLGMLDYNNKTEVKKFKKGQQEGLRLHEEGQQDHERCLHEESLQEERLRLHEEGQQEKKPPDLGMLH